MIMEMNDRGEKERTEEGEEEDSRPRLCVGGGTVPQVRTSLDGQGSWGGSCGVDKQDAEGRGRGLGNLALI